MLRADTRQQSEKHSAGQPNQNTGERQRNKEAKTAGDGGWKKGADVPCKPKNGASRRQIGSLLMVKVSPEEIPKCRNGLPDEKLQNRIFTLGFGSSAFND
jgi:hypothetical protein